MYVTGLLNTYLTELEDEVEDSSSQGDEEEDPSSKMLQGCLTAIVETLAYNNPKYSP